MKKPYILLFLLFTSVVASAQSVSKQINDIKRSSQYLSAEATMETESQAYELAEEMLSKQISEYAASQKSLKNAPNVIVKDVAGKAEKLQMNRGTMTRVFLYVRKNDIIAADNTRVLVQPQKNEESAPGEEKPKKDEQKKRKEAEKPDETPVSSVVPITSSPTTSTSQGNASLRLPESWQQTAIDNLLSCSTVEAAKEMMVRLRVEKKIKRFGPADSCPNASSCFWLIFDGDGRVITVLGDGQDERTNFRSMEKDTIDNYKGMGAIWFLFARQ